MKFKVEKNELMQSLLQASGAISGKTTNQLLDGVYIKADSTNNTLTLMGTNNDLSIKSITNADVESNGEIVVDKKIFTDIFRKLPNGDITVAISQDNLIDISIGKTDFKVVYTPGNNYPSFPQVVKKSSFKITQHILKDMIKEVIFAASKDDTRPILKGVLFEVIDNTLNLVTLDGYRLAQRSTTVDASTNMEAVVDGFALNEMLKLLKDSDEEFEVIFTENLIVLDLESTIASSRLLEGKYINYKSLLPATSTTIIEVNKNDFKDCIERASLIAESSSAPLISLSIKDNEMIISSKSPSGKSEEVFEFSRLSGQDTLDIAFNSKYLLDILKAVSTETVKMNLTNSVSPCLIQPSDDANYLVLPIRLIR